MMVKKVMMVLVMGKMVMELMKMVITMMMIGIRRRR